MYMYVHTFVCKQLWPVTHEHHNNVLQTLYSIVSELYTAYFQYTMWCDSVMCLFSIISTINLVTLIFTFPDRIWHFQIQVCNCTCWCNSGLSVSLVRILDYQYVRTSVYLFIYSLSHCDQLSCTWKVPGDFPHVTRTFNLRLGMCMPLCFRCDTVIVILFNF